MNYLLIIHKAPTDEQFLLLEKLLRTAEIDKGECMLITPVRLTTVPLPPIIIPFGLECSKVVLGNVNLKDWVGKPIHLGDQLIVPLWTLDKLLKGRAKQIEDTVRALVKCKNYIYSQCSQHS